MHGQMPNQPPDPEPLRALFSGSRLPKNVFPGIGVYIPAHPSSQKEPCTYFSQQNRKNGQALSCGFNTTEQLCWSTRAAGLFQGWHCPAQTQSPAQGAQVAITPGTEACPKSPLQWEAAFPTADIGISPAQTSVGSRPSRDGNTAQSYYEMLGEGRGLSLESMANTNIRWREFSIDTSYSYVHQ